jgi:hypothetical protein
MIALVTGSPEILEENNAAPTRVVSMGHVAATRHNTDFSRAILSGEPIGQFLGSQNVLPAVSVPATDRCTGGQIRSCASETNSHSDRTLVVEVRISSRISTRIAIRWICVCEVGEIVDWHTAFLP